MEIFTGESVDLSVSLKGCRRDFPGGPEINFYFVLNECRCLSEIGMEIPKKLLTWSCITLIALDKI